MKKHEETKESEMVKTMAHEKKNLWIAVGAEAGKKQGWG